MSADLEALLEDTRAPDGATRPGLRAEVLSLCDQVFAERGVPLPPPRIGVHPQLPERQILLSLYEVPAKSFKLEPKTAARTDAARIADVKAGVLEDPARARRRLPRPRRDPAAPRRARAVRAGDGAERGAQASIDHLAGRGAPPPRRRGDLDPRPPRRARGPLGGRADPEGSAGAHRVRARLPAKGDHLPPHPRRRTPQRDHHRSDDRRHHPPRHHPDARRHVPQPVAAGHARRPGLPPARDAGRRGARRRSELARHPGPAGRAALRAHAVGRGLPRRAGDSRRTSSSRRRPSVRSRTSRPDTEGPKASCRRSSRRSPRRSKATAWASRLSAWPGRARCPASSWSRRSACGRCRCRSARRWAWPSR